MTSISQTPDMYWQNEKLLPRYYERLDAGELPVACGYALNPDDQVRRETIMRLMCDMKLDYAAMSQSLGVDFLSYFAPEIAGLAGLEHDGLIETDDRGMQVTQSGRLLIRNIAMCFDPQCSCTSGGRLLANHMTPVAIVGAGNQRTHRRVSSARARNSGSGLRSFGSRRRQ